jgi:hypothetical protein
MTMEFGVLGSLEVRLSGADGEQVAVGGPRVRALLTLLLLEPGRVVRTDRLIDGLYGAEPPDGAANALQSQVSRLRRALGSAWWSSIRPATGWPSIRSRWTRTGSSGSLPRGGGRWRRGTASGRRPR